MSGVGNGDEKADTVRLKPDATGIVRLKPDATGCGAQVARRGRVFEWITSIVRRLGYTGVALLTLLENVFPPIPSELVIPLAGYVAAQGDLRLWLVIVMGSLGSLAGAWLWYELGRRIARLDLIEVLKTRE